MTMDITTIGIAVDSSPVDTAGAALDRMVAAGDRATAATARLAKASADSGRSMAGSLTPAAAKGAVAFKSVADAAAALGPAAAEQIAGLAGELGTVQRAAAATAGSLTAAGLSWREFVGQRMGPVMRELGAQGVPHKEAHTQAIRQIAQEWRQYKDAATAAHAAVSGQSAAAGAALAATAGQAAATARALDGMASAAERTSRRGTGSAAGLTEITTEATRAKAAVTDLSRATTSLGASAFVDFDKVTTSLGAAAAKASEAAREVHQLRTETAQLGALAGATTSLGARVGPQAPAANLREAIERRGMPTLDPRLAGGAAAATALAGAAGKATGQMDALGKSTKLAAWQTQQLGFQVHDFFVQIASGGSPLTALVQQGSQLSGTFGGTGNALRAVTSLITPFRLAVGGVAAAVGALAYSFYEGEKRSKAFADALLLSGNFAGQTEGRFNELARTVADSTASSVLKVRELGQALLATGEIGPQVFAQAQKAAVGYGEATGKTAEQVAKDFAAMSRDPAKFAAEANRQLNFLSSAQYQTIKAFQDNGRAADAQGVIYDALIQRFPKLQQNLIGLDSILAKGQQSWVRFWESAFAPSTIEDRIASVQARLEAMRQNVGGRTIVGPAGSAPAQGAIGRAETELADLRRRQFRQSENAAGDAFRAEVNKEAIAAQTIIDQWAKRGKAASMYREELEKLKRGFEANALAGTPVPKDVQEAAIKGLKQSFAGPKGRSNTEPDQIRREELANRLDAISVAAQRERDTFAFTHRFLQGEFQAGNQSLREYWDARRQVIADGVAAEVAELQKKKDAISADLDASGRVKDPSERLKLQGDIAKLTAQQEDLRVKAAREAVAANQEEAASFRQLADQVANYRANLLQLQGDEAGAAKVRAEQAIEQARRLARQSQGAAAAITPQEQAAERTAVQQVLALNQAKLATSVVNQRLQIEEDRIALAVQRGAISEIDAMGQVGAARSRAVAELEKVVAAQEAVAASRPQDYQLQIDTSRARLELERLRAELDPLKDKFDSILKDGTSNLLTDLMGGEKPLDALKGALNAVAGNINRMVSDQITQGLFARDGTFGGAGGFLADLFGGKDRAAKAAASAAPAIDTSGLTSSLAALQTAGADPATAALARLQVATDAAADTMSAVASPVLPREVTGVALPPVAGTTGDFARFDRQAGQASGIVQGEWDWMRRSSKGVADANEAAATAAIQLAQAASKGGGALSTLPQIVQMIIAATSTRGGGGFGGLLGSIFGGGGSVGNAGGTIATDEALALFFHRGGIVGERKDRRPQSVAEGLQPDEVPAILMGGPRGKREEVLTASDPRHRDNLRPHTAAILGLPRYHTGGLAGRSPDRLLPAAGVRYMTGGNDSQGGGKDDKAARAGDVYHLNVTVPMPQGASRSTAMQYGHAAGRQIQRALVHNGR